MCTFTAIGCQLLLKAYANKSLTKFTHFSSTKFSIINWDFILRSALPAAFQNLKRKFSEKHFLLGFKSWVFSFWYEADYLIIP